MKIQVDWYKETGKWYCGEEVEIGEAKLWDTEFKQAIVDNQNQLANWPRVNSRFYVVTRDTEANVLNPEFRGFNSALFTPGVFAGYRKQR